MRTNVHSCWHRARAQQQQQQQHFAERKRFNVYVQYLIGLNALNLGDTTTLEGAVRELENLGTVSVFGIHLPGLKELKAKAAM